MMLAAVTHSHRQGCFTAVKVLLALLLYLACSPPAKAQLKGLGKIVPPGSQNEEIPPGEYKLPLLPKLHELEKLSQEKIPAKLREKGRQLPAEVVGILEVSTGGWWIRCVAISPDGKWLAGGGMADEAPGVLISPTKVPGLRLWSTAELTTPIMSVPGLLTALAFSPDSSTLASSADGALTFWDLNNEKPVPLVIPKVKTSSVGASLLSFSPSRRELAIGTSIWPGQLVSLQFKNLIGDLDATERGNAERKIETNKMESKKKLAEKVALLKKAERLSDEWLRLTVEVESLTRALEFPETPMVTGVAFSPDDRCLVTVSEGAAFLWRRRKLVGFSAPERIRFAGLESVHSAAFAADNKTLAILEGDGTVFLCEHDSMQNKPRLLKDATAIRSFSFSPDGKHLATTNSGGRVMIWDHTTGKATHEVKDLPSPANAVTFAADARHLATANRDGKIYILRLNQSH